MSKSKRGIPFIDFWSMFYLLMVYTFTLIFDKANIIIFGIYFICAIPFIYHLDKFACICFLLSTMSYFFLGADEAIWSLYTILAIMMIFKTLTKLKISLCFKSVVYFLWLIVAIIISYIYSEFGYSKGMYAMIYNIAIAILLTMTMKINKDTIISFLPKIAVFQLITYIVMLLINGYYDGYGFSISKNINHNTFGASVAILSVIILVKIVFFREKALIYKFIWGVSLILTIVAGSRDALLAMILTSVIIY